MLRIYRYHVNVRRMGSLDGLFVVDDHGEQCLRALIESQRDIYYGEILGKYSEVTENLQASEITEVQATQEEIQTVLRVLGVQFDRIVAVITGECPLRCADTYELQDNVSEEKYPEMLLAWARGKGLYETDEDEEEPEEEG
jgi:hypothetical protein